MPVLHCCLFFYANSQASMFCGRTDSLGAQPEGDCSRRVGPIGALRCRITPSAQHNGFHAVHMPGPMLAVGLPARLPQLVAKVSLSCLTACPLSGVSVLQAACCLARCSSTLEP